MKYYRKVFASILSVAFFAMAAAFSLTYGQAQQQPAPATSEQPMGAGGGDPIRQLNLTPEQREQIRTIRQQTNLDRMNINRRVAEANRALEAALDSDNPDEAAVEQRMKDLAAAQADAMRMRISTEVKIRRVLTVEQRAILRTLRQEARESQRDRQDLRDQRQRRRDARPNGGNQRNGVGPFDRNIQRRPRP